MKVEQIYQIINNVTSEVLGKTGLIQEDLQGIVEVGEEIFNQNAVENYTKALVDHIGRMVFVNRVYQGTAPSVLMDSWEFGSVVEKVLPLGASTSRTSERVNALLDLIALEAGPPSRFPKMSSALDKFNGLLESKLNFLTTSLGLKLLPSYDLKSHVHTSAHLLLSLKMIEL